MSGPLLSQKLFSNTSQWAGVEERIASAFFLSIFSSVHALYEMGGSCVSLPACRMTRELYDER